jgi:dTDP-4-dehydrorhamnose reductase
MTAAEGRRVAVTGATGRLGSALVTSFERDGWSVLAWSRAEFDLDHPEGIGERLETESPDLVVHAAAWTDVDGCAREPDLALKRNGAATGTLAQACRALSTSLIIVSTNEVFDGTRIDQRGYRPEDPVSPANPYGRSKLLGEEGAVEAFGGYKGLGIVRTAWLFGSTKPDFPARIATAAQDALAGGRALRLVTDEVGTPTYVPDLSEAIVALSAHDFPGIHHVVNGGFASRADWGRDVLARLSIDVPIEEISLAAHARPSRPPRWGVLAPTPLPGGPLRPWQEAMSDRFAASGVGG